MKEKPLVRWLVRFGIILLVLFVLIPLLWLVAMSLKTQKQVTAIPPVWIHQPYFGNYVNFFMQGQAPKYYFKSFFIATTSTILSLIVGAGMAYGFSRSKYSFLGARIVLFGILVLRMFPPFSTIIPIYLAVRMLGIFDTFLALQIVYIGLGTPLIVWVMRGFFMGIPEEIEEAALLDGCSHMQMFVQIILPLSLPGLLSCAVISFIFYWNEFLFALFLTNTKAKTVPVLLATFSEDHIVIWGEVATLAVLAITPIILFGLLARKYLIRGLTFGAVKG